MAETIDIGTFIDRSPDVHNNRPKIAGTGVTVRRIAAWYTLGCTPEDIARKTPQLTLAQIHAALAYYHANSEEIERDLEADEALYEKLAAGQEQRRQAALRLTQMQIEDVPDSRTLKQQLAEIYEC